jgi:hypothetical protein
MRWKLRDVSILLLLAVALTGCDPTVEIRTACRGRLTGAINRTFSSCSSFDHVDRVSLGSTLLTGSFDEREMRGAEYSASFRLDEGVCTISVTEGSVTWLARTGSVPLGTCRLSYDEVVPFKPVGNLITYCILRGRLEGRLVPDPSRLPPMRTEPVDFTLDFNVTPDTDDPLEQRRICEKTQG